MAALLASGAIAMVPLGLFAGLPLPQSVELRYALQDLILLLGALGCAAAASWSLRLRWASLTTLALLFLASGVLLVQFPTPLAEPGRTLDITLSVLTALLLIALVFLPWGRHTSLLRTAPLGWTLAVATAASAAGAGYAVLAVRIAPSLQSDPGANWLFGGLTAETGLLVTIFAVVPCSSVGRLMRPISWHTGLRSMRTGAAAASGSLVLGAAVGQLMSAFGLDQAHIGNVPRLRPDEVLGPALLTSAVLPGVVEELFFRGLLFRWLSRTYPVWLAMLVSSGLFALWDRCSRSRW